MLTQNDQQYATAQNGFDRCTRINNLKHKTGAFVDLITSPKIERSSTIYRGDNGKFGRKYSFTSQFYSYCPNSSAQSRDNSKQVSSTQIKFLSLRDQYNTKKSILNNGLNSPPYYREVGNKYLFSLKLGALLRIMNHNLKDTLRILLDKQIKSKALEYSRSEGHFKNNTIDRFQYYSQLKKKTSYESELQLPNLTNKRPLPYNSPERIKEKSQEVTERTQYFSVKSIEDSFIEEQYQDYNSAPQMLNHNYLKESIITPSFTIKCTELQNLNLPTLDYSVLFYNENLPIQFQDDKIKVQDQLEENSEVQVYYCAQRLQDDDKEIINIRKTKKMVENKNGYMRTTVSAQDDNGIDKCSRSLELLDLVIFIYYNQQLLFLSFKEL